MEKFLKTLLLLFVLMLPIGMTSCGDDHTDEPGNETGDTTNIYGTWRSSKTEIEDGTTITTSYTLTFNQNGTGSLSATMTVSSRASTSVSLNEIFSWSLNQDSDNVQYLSFIHTNGDEIFGTGRYYCTIAGGALSIGNLVFTR